MLLRLLFFFVLSYLIFALVRVVLSWLRRQGGGGSRERSEKAEEMVLDPQCRSYLPKGEAIPRGGHYFCSEECATVYLSREQEKDEGGRMKDENGRKPG